MRKILYYDTCIRRNYDMYNNNVGDQNTTLKPQIKLSVTSSRTTDRSSHVGGGKVDHLFVLFVLCR